MTPNMKTKRLRLHHIKKGISFQYVIVAIAFI